MKRYMQNQVIIKFYGLHTKMSSSLLALVVYDSSFLSIATLHVRVKAMKRDTVNIAIVQQFVFLSLLVTIIYDSSFFY